MNNKEIEYLKSFDALVESQQATIHTLLWELGCQKEKLEQANKEITDLSQTLEAATSELERLKKSQTTCNATQEKPAAEKPTQSQKRNDDAKTILIFRSIFPY